MDRLGALEAARARCKQEFRDAWIACDYEKEAAAVVELEALDRELKRELERIEKADEC